MKKLIVMLSLVVVGAASLFAVSCKDDKSITYSFETNGGTEISAVQKNPGEEYVLPVPEREGYEFDGWYLSQEFDGTPVDKASASESVVYYAKWSKLFTITLELDGGSLSAGSSLSLKENSNVYDFMAAYKPEKGGFVFGAWYEGDAELARNKRITADITLTAKYKVEYTVEIYKQNFEGTAYEKDEAVITGADYVGTEISPDPTFTGFRQADNEQEVLSIVLGADKNANVLKFYFDREEYTVSFNANNPDGSAGERRSLTVKYGEGVDCPNDFTFEGYCLAGWSETREGEVQYPVDYIGTVLYNKEGYEPAPVEKFMPERNTALYAVWVAGYTDMFGGNDYIYLFDKEGDDIYLARGGVFFKGEYMPESATFLFENPVGETLEGKLNNNGTYSYKSDARALRTYYSFVNGKGIDKNSTITFDKYNGVVLSEKPEGEEEVALTSSGYYFVEVDEAGYEYYHVTFTDGELKGQERYLRISSTRVDNATEYIFVMRNEEELALGSIPRFGVTPDGKIGTFVNNLFSISLDGFGMADFVGTNGQAAKYYYVMEEEEGERTLNLINPSSSTLFLKARLITNEGTLGYVLYNEDLDVSIQQDGATLTLDGLFNLTYTDGDTTVSGYFSYTGASVTGGLTVLFKTPAKTCAFLIYAETIKETNEQGEQVSVTKYSFKEKPVTYAEYYYRDAQGIYYTYLVLDDEEQGKASLYVSERSGKTFEKLAEGTYVLDEGGKSGVFTKTASFEVELKSPVDMSAIDSFVFNLGVVTSGSASYEVVYWVSSSSVGENTEYGKKYTSQSGASLVLVAGFAIYSEGTEKAAGAYTLNKDVVTIALSSTSGVYLKLDEENASFIKLEYAPYSITEWLPDGKSSENTLLYFDGLKGSATYVIATSATEYEEKKGTFVQTDRTTFAGNYIFTFTAEDGTTFDYIRMNSSNAAYFAKYNGEYNGDYETADGCLLRLDGYSYAAYLNSDDVPGVNGFYYFAGDNLIRWYVSVNGSVYSRYIDVNEDRTFSIRGMEYGRYLLSDNRNQSRTYIDFDGYGSAKVVKLNADGETVIDGEARYEQSEGITTLTYTDNGDKKSLVGRLMFSSSAQYFVVIHGEVAQTYVNEKDYTVLTLDDAGNAVKYDAVGKRTVGAYTIVNENLLFYSSAKSGELSLYSYNVEKATATPITTEDRYYFTSSLEALKFTRYGYAEYRNAQLCYYYIDENGNIIMYRTPDEGSDAVVNDYGFTEYNFGKFEKQKEFDGKLFYENSGISLEFNRGETGEDVKNYPLPLKINEDFQVTEDGQIYPIEELVFNPAGSEEFTVNGTVKINGKTLPVTVVRKTNEDGVIETYFTIALTLGYFRYDIDINFKAEDAETGESLSTYTIKALRRQIDFPAYNVAYYQYMFSMLDSILGTNYSATLVNTIGEITCRADYDKAGEIIGEEYINATFGEGSGIYDADGNLITISGAKYTYEKNVYTVDFKAADGYDYRLRFQPRQVSGSLYGYGLVALTRVQTFEQGDLIVEIERLIATDMTGMTPGNPYRASISRKTTDADGNPITEEIAMTNGIILEDGSLLYIARTVDENKIITATEYYEIAFTEKDGGSVGDTEKQIILPYESISLTHKQIKTCYAQTEKNDTYVDLDEETNTIRMVNFAGRMYYVLECTYDEQTKTYTATTYNGKFTVTISEEGVATVTAVEE